MSNDVYADITREWLESIGWDTKDELRPGLGYWISRGGDRLRMEMYLSAGQVFLNGRMIAFAGKKLDLIFLLDGLGAPLCKTEKDDSE